MKSRTMLARNLLLAACFGACFTLACGDDDDSGPPGGESGEAGQAGRGGSGQAGKGGDTPSAGTAGKAGGPAGQGGEPSPGTGGMPTEPGAAGGGGDAPETFVGFVHDLVQNRTSDVERPVTAERQFTEERDERGHYLTPRDAFDDLF